MVCLLCGSPTPCGACETEPADRAWPRSDVSNVYNFTPGRKFIGHYAFTPEEFWHEAGEDCFVCRSEAMAPKRRGVKVVAVDEKTGMITFERE